MAPDPTDFSSNLFVTKVKMTRVMHVSQQKDSKKQNLKRTTSKRKKESIS